MMPRSCIDSAWNLLVRSAIVTSLLTAAFFAQSAANVSVTGNVPQPLTLTAADLAKLPRAKVGAYEGVWLHDVLVRAGFTLGSEQAGYVVATAADSYRALFSLAEIDPTITENQVLIADKVDGQPLSGRDGTFRLVAPRDIRSVRGVRQLTKIEIVLLAPEKK
jgi:DMSO/TMAO reductase YedYZ molybdopterin-dependent catalytic subunit